MFRSIRTKLVLSYALTILLCLLLAGLGALLLIRRYQRAAILSQRRAVAASLSEKVQTLLASRLNLPEAAARVRQEAAELGVRALLVTRDGLVVADTGDKDSLVGQHIRLPLPELADSQGTPVTRRYLAADGKYYYFITFLLRPPPPDNHTQGAGLPTLLVAVVPEQEVEPAWRQVVPSLAIAGAVSLCISIVIAILLARSITRPLIAMTKASEQIALGNYQQEIRTEGQDEVARLADSFNRMAREVERSRQSQRDFLTNVSHDLKTPLTSIQGFSQAILEGAVHDKEGYRRSAQVINEEAVRTGRLVECLLDLARLDAGAAMRSRTAISIDRLAQRCRQKLAPLAAQANVDIQVAIDTNPPAFYGDEERLEQALSNLLDNAIKYTPPGGKVKVAVDIQEGSAMKHATAHCVLAGSIEFDASRWITISVEDNGPGVPKEDLSRIFERFYRADKSRGGARGSGLGLAIAKEIVEAHGGTIAASSQPGHGSRFSIFLPVA